MLENESKPLVWMKGEVKSPPFSPSARLEAGILLRRLQRGESLSLPHARPIPIIDAHCHELRIRDENQTWRIVYAIEPDAIVILEVFSKKTRAMPKSVINSARRRLMLYRTLS
ncbi:MAG: type II toxin-antitoxin system RelE/ParE family toxin [Bacteroidota bacterium]|nr:type II toxin-antitoxin system RelE/ParE family toxin [Bacteroidota bacterium]